MNWILDADIRGFFDNLNHEWTMKFVQHRYPIREFCASSKQTFRFRMHEPVPKVGEWLRRVLEGFYQYYAVPGNWRSLHRFRLQIGRYWRHVLRRRSQCGHIKAVRMGRLLDRWLPPPRQVHPYPSVRFDATHPR